MEMTGDSVRRKSELLRVGCFLLSFTFYCTFSEVVRMLLLNQKKTCIFNQKFKQIRISRNISDNMTVDFSIVMIIGAIAMILHDFFFRLLLRITRCLNKKVGSLKYNQLVSMGKPDPHH